MFQLNRDLSQQDRLTIFLDCDWPQKPFYRVAAKRLMAKAVKLELSEVK